MKTEMHFYVINAESLGRAIKMGVLGGKIMKGVPANENVEKYHSWPGFFSSCNLGENTGSLLFHRLCKAHVEKYW